MGGGGRDGDAEPGDSYRSVMDGPEVEIKVKGSRFLAKIFAVEDEPFSVERLEGVRKRHHAATHHCWARRIGGVGAAAER